MRGNLFCKHRTEKDISPLLVDLVLCIEQATGLNLYINSGCRCPDCNRMVDGAARSAHQKEPHKDKLSKAFDIKYNNSEELHAILTNALVLGICRFGIGKTYIHLDIGDEEDGYPQCRTWVY